MKQHPRISAWKYNLFVGSIIIVGYLVYELISAIIPIFF